MIKIGITGSLASGKTTASKYLSSKRGPLFSADVAVKELYQNKRFRSLISKKFKIKNNNKIKKFIKKLVLIKKSNISKLEKLIHPLVEKNGVTTYKEKKCFFMKYRTCWKLMRFFNIIIFIKLLKIILKRFKINREDKKLFNLSIVNK